MKFRAAASIALAVAVAAGLAGCNMISPQRTNMAYDASDGVGVSVGDLELRNVLVLAEAEDGLNAEQGTLIASVVNHSGEAGTITVSSGSARAEIPVEATDGITAVGYDDGPTVDLTGIELPVGGTIEITFTSAGGATATANVPVLDGALAEYATLIPTAPTETEPAPADPTATEPGATDPAATEPGAIEPEATEPPVQG